MPADNTNNIIELRCRLMRGGFSPIPIMDRSKKPALEKGWQTKLETNQEEIRTWSQIYPAAISTGLLCERMPAFDIDILDKDAADAVEELVQARFEDERLLVRTGLPPKRAILFRTAVPFKKITASLIAPNGSTDQKFEFLGAGQQIVAYGIHEKTGRPYYWSGGEPGDIVLADLPDIDEATAQALVDDAVELLVREHGYRLVPSRKRKANGDGNGNGNGYVNGGGSDDWSYLIENILAGNALHESLRDLAAKLVRSGMKPGAVVNYLRGQMQLSNAPKDDRWQARFDDIPRLVSGAETFREPEPEPTPPANSNNPVDLWGSFNPPEMPMGLLPKVIEGYAVAQGRTMGADPGGIAMAALAVCAAAIPDRIKLVMKPGDSWRESARLWVALVGTPSTKKSSIVSEVMAPLARLDAILLNKYLADLKEWEQLDKDEKKAQPRPVQRRHRLEDTTIEAAQEVLAGSPDGVLLVQDELSGFFGSMDKYSGHRGAAKDRGFWLQTFNGGQYALNRINRGVSMIPNLSVNLLGGIQPDVIRKVAGESYDDGFLQRMLMVMLRPATIGLNAATQGTSADYRTLIERLTRLQLPVSGNMDRDDGVLRFSNRAQDIRGELEARHLSIAQAIETFNGKLAAHIGKYDGLFGRLCVLFHCIENSGSPATPARSYLPEFISVDTADRVSKFVHQYLLPHAFGFYSGVLKLSDDHDRLINVAGYILTREDKTVLTNRDVQMGCRTMRKLGRRDIESVFEQLDALGWVTMVPGPRKTDPPHWAVNTSVHLRFAERAKAENDRRLRVREIVTSLPRRESGG